MDQTERRSSTNNGYVSVIVGKYNPSICVTLGRYGLHGSIESILLDEEEAVEMYYLLKEVLIERKRV